MGTTAPITDPAHPGVARRDPGHFRSEWWKSTTTSRARRTSRANSMRVCVRTALPRNPSLDEPLAERDPRPVGQVTTATLSSWAPVCDEFQRFQRLIRSCQYLSVGRTMPHSTMKSQARLGDLSPAADFAALAFHPALLALCMACCCNGRRLRCQKPLFPASGSSRTGSRVRRLARRGSDFG